MGDVRGGEMFVQVGADEATSNKMLACDKLTWARLKALSKPATPTSDAKCPEEPRKIDRWVQELAMVEQSPAIARMRRIAHFQTGCAGMGKHTHQVRIRAEAFERRAVQQPSSPTNRQEIVVGIDDDQRCSV
ncbi:hypothetical protein [Qipengyuania sp. DGS5-3]|uniref:hypothetical protein n=1 Tax=Qipengyuania sp. DGS5-3 TaxID=3349632 RepID=UPI0036D24A3D